MRTLIFCTSYLDNEESWTLRYKPWLQYHRKIGLDGNFICLIDDGGSYCPRNINIFTPDGNSSSPNSPEFIYRFKNRLGRQSLTSYPGWWRSFFFATPLAMDLNMDRIIHIESDAYILSEKLIRHIQSISTGWTTLWSEHFRLPETAIQIICKDQFPKIAELSKHSPEFLSGKFAENILPFTEVNKSFVGDRYGEIRRNRWILRSKKFNRFSLFEHPFFWAKIPKDADFATQVTKKLWDSSPCLQRRFAEISELV